MKKLIAVSLAAALLGTAGGAQAQSRNVRFDDLNLSSPAGQKRLDLRIRNAARALCAYPEYITGSRVLPADRQSCMRMAIARAHYDVAQATSKRRLG